MAKAHHLVGKDICVGEFHGKEVRLHTLWDEPLGVFQEERNTINMLRIVRWLQFRGEMGIGEGE